MIIGEDWNWTMYTWVRAYGYGSSVSYNIAIFFFLLVMIMGNIVLFSVFTAILLENFEEEDPERDEEEEEGENPEGEEKKEEEAPKGCFAKMCDAEKWEGIKTEFKEAFGKKQRQPKTI